jgi:ADP-heptose:LPS heptosyltransferase
MINLLRRLDCFIGKSAYLYLRCRRAGTRKKMPAASAVKKILCIKLWGLGNLTVIYPLLYKLKERYPNAEIIFLTFDLNREFLENNRSVNKIFYFKFTTNIFLIIKQCIKLVKIFRKERIDLLINFETFNNASALLSCSIKPFISIGLNNKYENGFYVYPVNNPKTEHISRVFSSLLEPAGINCGFSYFYLNGSPKDKEEAARILDSLKIKDFICIHAGTSGNFKGKRYPQDYFSRLADLLINKYGYPVIFTGTKEERDIAESIISRCRSTDKIFNLNGKLSIWEFVELLKKSKLLISSDSGPVHIAASLGVNTVAFYGATSPRKYRPLNENSLVFYKGLDCSPCVGIDYINRNCGDKFKCLNFQPEEVVSGISRKFFHE